MLWVQAGSKVSAAFSLEPTEASAAMTFCMHTPPFQKVQDHETWNCHPSFGQQLCLNL